MISVIVPIYNTQEYLKRCVESVLTQTFMDFELILVNDGSTDNSGEICDELAAQDTRIKVLHSKNGGVSNARNKGIDIAQGEYIAFIDSDDTVKQGWLEDISSKGNNADVIFFGVEHINGNVVTNINVLQDFYAQNKEIFKIYVKEFYMKLFGSACNKLYKKSIIQEYNIRFNEHLAINEDAFFDYDVLSKCNTFLNVSKAYYQYHHYPTSSSNRGREDVLKVFLLRSDRHQQFLNDMHYTDIGLPTKNDVIATGVISHYMQAAISTNSLKYTQRINILKEIYSNPIYKKYLLDFFKDNMDALPLKVGAISAKFNMPSILAILVSIKKFLNKSR